MEDDITLLINPDPDPEDNGELSTTSPEYVDEAAPPPYSDQPPPYEQNDVSFAPNNILTHTQSVGVMGEPTVVCRVCQQLIFIRGREGQRVVKCQSCQEATPIKAPPTGKKYIRCPCNALLTCRLTSTRISCPRTNCKRVINVGGFAAVPNPPSTAIASSQISEENQRSQVACGHCNAKFFIRTKAHLVRCPYCRKVSSIGVQFAKNRALAFGIIGILFLIIGIGVTVGTYKLAQKSAGIYVTWFGAFLIGIVNLIRSIYYCTMTISHIDTEN